jgi:hypothetical protein
MPWIVPTCAVQIIPPSLPRFVAVVNVGSAAGVTAGLSSLLGEALGVAGGLAEGVPDGVALASAGVAEVSSRLRPRRRDRRRRTCRDQQEHRCVPLHVSPHQPGARARLRLFVTPLCQHP